MLDVRKPDTLLDVRGLHTYFYTYEGIVKAVNSVSYGLNRGEITGLVGESGSGKSVTAQSIIQLVKAPGRIVSGEVWLDGEDLMSLSQAEMQAVRGRKISMIFQEPRAAPQSPLHRGRPDKPRDSAAGGLLTQHRRKPSRRNDARRRNR